MTNFHQATYFIKHYFTAKRNGHGVHSPFAYQLCEEVFYNTNYFYDFDTLKKIREVLLKDATEIDMVDLGAGSKTFTSDKRKISDISKKGISTVKQSELIYKLINFLNCNTSIELGTSIGLNTLYMALANKNGKLKSIEGSKDLFDFASELAKKNNVNNIEFINSNFNTSLPDILENLNSLDLIYIDGNHTYEATLNYFKLALKKKHNNSVFIFDDIYWSPEMTKAWQEIQKHVAVTLSIDAFYFGMLFFKEEVKEKVELKFYI